MWSNQISGARHHQPFCVGCRSNYVGVSYYSHRGRGFRAWKREKRSSIISPSKHSHCEIMCQNSSTTPDKLSDGGCYASNAVWDSAQQLWCTSDLTLLLLCVTLRLTHFEIHFERPEWPVMDPSVQIQQESHFLTTCRCVWDLIGTLPAFLSRI